MRKAGKQEKEGNGGEEAAVEHFARIRSLFFFSFPAFLHS